MRGERESGTEQRDELASVSLRTSPTTAGGIDARGTFEVQADESLISKQDGDLGCKGLHLPLPALFQRPLEAGHVNLALGDTDQAFLL